MKELPARIILTVVVATERGLKGLGAAWFLTMALYGTARAAVDVTRPGWPHFSLEIDQTIALAISGGALLVLLLISKSAS